MSTRSFTHTLFVLSVISLSCSSPNGPEPPFRMLEGVTPIVTGIRITNPSGPTELATWGMPSDPLSQFQGGKLSTDLGMENPYPNPSDGPLVMMFGLVQPATVSIWAVRARASGTELSDLVDYGGGEIYTPVAIVVKKLLTNASMQSGRYMVTWDTRDDNGELLPRGFYRIYFRAGDYVTYHDVLIYRSFDDLPADLRSLMNLRHGN